jgi:hypothetical protein
MRNYGLLAFLFIFLLACTSGERNEQSADYTNMSPAEVSKAWQRAIDINDFETAKSLSTAKTKEFVASIEKLIGDDPSLETVDTTIFISMDCSESGTEAKCIYRFRLEGEAVTDSFFLLRQDDRWLVDIQEEVMLDDSDTEQLLEELYNLKAVF